MGLEIGIVGLPNVGKSTLFNALLKKQVAYVANYPFATIEPNVGIVPVPDDRLNKLADVIAATIDPSTSLRTSRPPIKPAVVRFIDIAGLVAGASTGAGLGNKFLSHIREVDAICQVVRKFADENIIREGSINPKSDFDTIMTELELADLESKEKREQKKKDVVEELPLLAKKPMIVVLNVDEGDLIKAAELEASYAKEFGVDADKVIAICAKTEAELAEMSESDQKDYLAGLGLTKSGLERLVVRAFDILGLQTFLTAGEIEARAWTIHKGMKGPQAAGVIHTDFEKHFIKADVIDFVDFVKYGGWEKARELGKVRLEGKDYVMREGDVVEFKVGV